MRACIIFGPGSSQRDLRAFRNVTGISWQTGTPFSKDEADVILLFGGDGTLHRHLARLVELQLPVLVAPRGSGNDFARALGLRGMNDSLAAWQKFVSGAGHVRPVDVGVIKALESAHQPSASQEHYFATVAGVGLDGEVIRRTNHLPRWFRGNGGYALTLLPTLFRFAALPMKIMLMGKTTDSSPRGDFQSTVLAAFANVPTFGGGMKIAPQARFDDGELDVCIIRNIDKFKLFCLFPTVYFGQHLSMKEVEYSRAVSVRVESEYPLNVYADGEYVCRTPIEVSLKRNALRVIVPE